MMWTEPLHCQHNDNLSDLKWTWRNGNTRDRSDHQWLSGVLYTSDTSGLLRFFQLAGHKVKILIRLLLRECLQKHVTFKTLELKFCHGLAHSIVLYMRCIMRGGGVTLLLCGMTISYTGPWPVICHPTLHLLLHGGSCTSRCLLSFSLLLSGVSHENDQIQTNWKALNMVKIIYDGPTKICHFRSNYIYQDCQICPEL